MHPLNTPHVKETNWYPNSENNNTYSKYIGYSHLSKMVRNSITFHVSLSSRTYWPTAVVSFRNKSNFLKQDCENSVFIMERWWSFLAIELGCFNIGLLSNPSLWVSLYKRVVLDSCWALFRPHEWMLCDAGTCINVRCKLSVYWWLTFGRIDCGDDSLKSFEV